MISVFEKIFRNKIAFSFHIEDEKHFFSELKKLLDNSDEIVEIKNEKLYFGTIDEYEKKFCLTKKINRKSQNYNVEGKIVEGDLQLNYSFSFQKLRYQIFVMVLTYLFLISAIFNESLSLLLFSIVYYLLFDFLFYLILHLSKKDFHEDFAKRVKLL
ncbi:hypothetical protein EQG68_01230 [Flavobacterium piscinae]|uniref:Uncharacterized protein n=1 Tax=Flavobacterium piscinae TaxID=2506424 RepID=A0A4Q1L0X6_9FLAO|nr:hypothetical protein [Flavobacterium piscinae]RXR35549.1 hypothetical protein EQG68_01230 [Flavobacterium piscinae]